MTQELTRIRSPLLPDRRRARDFFVCDMVAPSAQGLATVHDRDILIYCASHLMASLNLAEASSWKTMAPAVCPGSGEALCYAAADLSRSATLLWSTKFRN